MSGDMTVEERIERDREKASQIWSEVVLPDILRVKNNSETGDPDPHDVDLSYTVEAMREIGSAIFESDYSNHNVALSMDNPRRISYASNEAHRFDKDKRIRTTVQRYVTRNFRDIYPDLNERGVDMFAEKFFAKACDDLDTTFRVVRGREIVRLYRQCWGAGSCMTGEDSHLTNLYANNSDICSMLVYDGGEDRHGRALLWETDQGDTICDRIYPNSGQHVEKYRLYCEKHGIAIRDGNGCPNSEWTSYCQPPKVKFSTDKTYTVTVKHGTDCGMPYLDSLHWGYVTYEGEVELTTDATGNAAENIEYAFSSIRGHWDEHEMETCPECAAVLREDMGVVRWSGGHWCGECHESCTEVCPECDERCMTDSMCEVITRPDCESSSWCTRCVDYHSHCCTSCSSQVAKKLVLCIEDEWYCPDCYNDKKEDEE